MKFGHAARRGGAGIACALMLSVCAPAFNTAYGLATPAVLLPVPGPGTGGEPATDPGGPAPVTDPGGEDPVSDPGGHEPGTGPDGEDPVTDPTVEVPAEPAVTPVDVQPPSEIQLPAAPAQLPAPEQIFIPEAPVVEEEPAPVTEPAAPSLTPTAAPATSTAAAAALLPPPMAKAIDSVVATASGSPLYVQVLTVALLLGAGFLYFRVLGSKGRRSPIRPGK